MPGEGVPQHELLRLQAKFEQRAPYDSRCRLGKTIWTLFLFARSPWLDAGKNIFRFNTVISLFSEQDSLGSHRDTAEMSAAITERFADHRKFYFAESFSKISS